MDGPVKHWEAVQLQLSISFRTIFWITNKSHWSTECDEQVASGFVAGRDYFSCPEILTIVLEAWRRGSQIVQPTLIVASGNLNCLDNQRDCRGSGVWLWITNPLTYALTGRNLLNCWVWYLVCIPNCSGKTNTFPTCSLWTILGLQRWLFYSQLSNPQVSSRFLSCWGRVHKERSPSIEIVSTR